MSAQVTIGDQLLELRPLYGIEQLETFRQGLHDTVTAAGRLWGLTDREPTRQEAGGLMVWLTTGIDRRILHLVFGIDLAELLRLGCPELTDALIDSATPDQRLELLVATVNLNVEQLRPLVAAGLLESYAWTSPQEGV